MPDFFEETFEKASRILPDQVKFKPRLDPTLPPRPIAEGAFSCVYKGLFGEKKVALKEIIAQESKKSSQKVESPEEKIKQEIVFSYIANAAPNAVTFYGYIEWEKRVTLVFHFVPMTLASYLEKLAQKELNDDDFSVRYKIAEQVVACLAYLHTHNPQIFHCDIKPGNILVDKAFNAKVADFGSARMADKLSGYPGTPIYKAPELLMQEAYPSEKTDLYSFGAMLWQMTTFNAPYKKHSRYMADLINFVCGQKNRDPIPTDRQKCPVKIAILIKWSLLPSADERPETKELANEFEYDITTLSPNLVELQKKFWIT